MSSSCGFVCLLVLLGFVAAFGRTIPSSIDGLKQAHEFLANELKLKNGEIAGHPLFNSVINSINISCQRKDEIQLMNVTLDIYLQIFSSILDHSDNSESPTLLDSVPNQSQVERSLKMLKREMEVMKRHLNHLSQMNRNREDVLHELRRIKVDKPVEQKKALAQFMEIYAAASMIGQRCGPAHASSAK
ncbi:interferon gamma 1-like [Xyrichtys novacula]|uniref:Interferon gamma 1-like n=1 Tax=Xyrichtys novacula TaxID=13765 RepID=A0AAV1F1A6_XYRNO|nr:interferon gamma 1-like [Xyrichtys novacula]